VEWVTGIGRQPDGKYKIVRVTFIDERALVAYFSMLTNLDGEMSSAIDQAPPICGLGACFRADS
jgi:hypothetical protein